MASNQDPSPAIPAPPSIPTEPVSEANTSMVEEPPLKRMKVDAPQIPHYNSHNIYSRPPAPPSNIAIPSLPVIHPPVTPLDTDSSSQSNNAMNEMEIESNIAPLSEPAEEWPICAYCNQGGELSRCSSCRQAYYCNRKCQVAHWEVHCIVCQPGPPQPPSLPQAGQPVAPPTTFTPYSANGVANAAVYTPSSAAMSYSNGAYSAPNRVRTPRSQNYDRNETGSKEQYYCEECDRFFKNGQALGGHRSRVHSSRRNGDPNAPTPTPAKKRSRSSRARHEPTGSGQYVCPHCPRTFATGNALGGHISGAHTKKSRKLLEQQRQMQEQQMQMQQQGHPPRFARPRYPNM